MMITITWLEVMMFEIETWLGVRWTGMWRDDHDDGDDDDDYDHLVGGDDV